MEGDVERESLEIVENVKIFSYRPRYDKTSRIQIVPSSIDQSLVQFTKRRFDINGSEVTIDNVPTVDVVEVSFRNIIAIQSLHRQSIDIISKLANIEENYVCNLR